MKSKVEIDEKLLMEALEVTGAKTKAEAVELGLGMLIRLKPQVRIRKLRGKLRWTGDLDEMRRD